MAKDVILLGSGSLFVKILEAPPAMSNEDMRDYVETFAEQLSPLPPEALRFSYMRKGASIVLFAGSKDRLFAEQEKNSVESATLVVPAIALLKNVELPDGPSLFEVGDSITLIECENGVWKNLTAMPMRGNRMECSAKLLKAAGKGDSIGDISFFALASHSLRSNKLEFELLQYRGVPSEIGESSSHVKALNLSISKRELLESDIRDKRAMKKIGIDRRNKALTQARAYILPALFIILLALQCLQWYELAGLRALESEYESIAPKAKLAELKSEEIAKMLQFTEKMPLPMEMLAAVNASRPDSVAFSRVSVSEGKNIEIKATAPSISAANSYLEALKSDKKIASASAKTETSKNGAKLTLSAKLK